MCDTLDWWTYIYCVWSDVRRLLDCGNYRERKEQDFRMSGLLCFLINIGRTRHR